MRNHYLVIASLALLTVPAFAQGSNIQTTVQLGSHNSASTTQSGNSNHSSIVQIGHGWSQSVTQTGSQQGFSSTQISTPAGSGQWSTSAGGNTVVLQLGAPQPSQPVP